MRVGLTYDLKDDYLAAGMSSEACAEFDSIDTIDAIDAVLTARGYETERIGNIKALTAQLANGKRWDLVFNIAEGLYGNAREAQVPALLDAYQIPYVFSDPVVLALTLDKALTKRIVRDAGLATAPFTVIGVGEDVRTALSFPLFVKPLSEGTGKGITAKSLVATQAELTKAVSMVHETFAQAALVEAYLSGREFTVGIVGTGSQARSLGVMEILFNERADACGYTYDNKQHYETRVSYDIVTDDEAKQAEELALNAWRMLGCRDGGRIDLRSDAHHQPHFLEVNPLAGLHPVLGDLVILCAKQSIPYAELLGAILDSAMNDPQRFYKSLKQAC